MRTRAPARVSVGHRPVSAASMTAAVRKVREMLKVQMPAESTGDERNRAQQKADAETDQIEIRPSHRLRLAISCVSL